MDNERRRKGELVLEFAESICKEAKFYAEDPWGNPEPWRTEPATPKQIRQIQSRRCGPNFQERIPEPLYKAVLFHVVNGISSALVKSKGQAADVLNAFAYCDQDVMRQWEYFIERVVENHVPTFLPNASPTTHGHVST